MKNKIRKLIVKHFALSYSFKLFGTTLTSLRASRVIMPLFILSGILTVANPIWPTIVWYTFISYTLTAIAVWLGFIYFWIWPVKREELDEEQKKQFDMYPYNK